MHTICPKIFPKLHCFCHNVANGCCIFCNENILSNCDIFQILTCLLSSYNVGELGEKTHFFQSEIYLGITTLNAEIFWPQYTNNYLSLKKSSYIGIRCSQDVYLLSYALLLAEN